MDVRVGLRRKLSTEKLMFLNCGVGEDSWESPGLQRDSTSPFYRKSVLNIHWKEWCSSWNSSSLAIWWEELAHLKRSGCWERLKVVGEGNDRGWDGWMASLTQWTWVWVNSRSWWWTGRPGLLQSMGLQRVGQDWVAELNWTEQWMAATKMNGCHKNTVCESCIASVRVCVSCSVVSNSLWIHGLCPPVFSVYGIFQARVLEWVAMSFFRGSFQPRDGTWVSVIAGRFFTVLATREMLHVSPIYSLQ